jgi:hypothetical protein
VPPAACRLSPCCSSLVTARADASRAAHCREPALQEVVVVAVRCNVQTVETGVDMTEADARLLAELTSLGVSVTARQLKRWRAAGLLPIPIQVSAGRGHGRRSVTYPAATAELVVAVADMLQDGWLLRYLAFGLFARGYEVSEAALKRSYRAVIHDVREMVMQLARGFHRRVTWVAC